MEHEVFISYSSNDKAIADAICHVLEHNGITCWIAPRDVRPGIPYAREIISGIKKCQVMILVFTSHSNSSDHVGNEIDMAFNSGKTIIPFLVDDTPMNEELKYYLARKHWLVAYPNYEKRFEELLIAVSNVLGRKLAPIDKKIETLVPKEEKAEMVYLKVLSNMDCRVLIDSEEIGIARGNVLLKISLNPGEYYIQFVSVENEEDVITYDISLEHDVLKKVDLMSIKNERLSSSSEIIACEESVDDIVSTEIPKKGSDGGHKKTILCATEKGNIIAYNLETSECLLHNNLIPNEVFAGCIVFSANGNLVAYVTLDNKIIVAETFTGQKICELAGHKDKINSMAFAPDGRTLISVSDDESTRVWDIASASQKNMFYNLLGKLEIVIYSRTGKYFAVLPWASSKVVIYDTNSLKKIQQINHKTGLLGTISYISFSYDEQELYACSMSKIYISNIKSGKQVVSKKNGERKFNILKNIINVGTNILAFSSFNEIFTLHTSTELFSILKLRELNYDENKDISCLIYSESDNCVISGSSKGYVNVVSKENGRIIAHYHSDEEKIVAVSLCYI